MTLREFAEAIRDNALPIAVGVLIVVLVGFHALAWLTH